MSHDLEEKTAEVVETLEESVPEVIEVEKRKVRPRPVRQSGLKGDYKEKVKKFLVRVKTGATLYEVYFTEGGEIPKVLKDSYTSHAEAHKAIKLYEATRKQTYS